MIPGSIVPLHFVNWGLWIALIVYMLQLSALVDCAIENTIFGPETLYRFGGFSEWILEYTLFIFWYFLFVDGLVWFMLYVLGFLSFGISWTMFMPLYWFISRYLLSFIQLYWDNEIYNAFHPVVAPEITIDTKYKLRTFKNWKWNLRVLIDLDRTNQYLKWYI